MNSPNAWRPQTTHPPTQCVSSWDEDEHRSVQVLCRVKADGKFSYFIARLHHWPEDTPQWRTTCSESWTIRYEFEWKFIEEQA